MYKGRKKGCLEVDNPLVSVRMYILLIFMILCDQRNVSTHAERRRKNDKEEKEEM
jgi:hypothetical protein